MRPDATNALAEVAIAGFCALHVRAHTIDAAFSIRAEDRLGSIEAGKLADLVVIDGDPFSAPDVIGDLGIWMTMLAGTTVVDPASG
jgi:predicted amidohydrolase YtcJ